MKTKMTATIRLLIHSTSGSGSHTVDYHWIREEELTPQIQGYLEEIEDGLVIDDGQYEPFLTRGARKFIESIGTEESRVWSDATLLDRPRVTKIYTIVETNY